MGLFARLRSTQGHAPVDTAITPTTAVAFPIQSDKEVYYVTGTVTIPSIATTQGTQPWRTITFIGAASAAVTFTNTPATTTAGLMDLGVDDIKLQFKDSITLRQHPDGSWNVVNYNRSYKGTATTGNVPGVVTVTTATAMVIPDNNNFFAIAAVGAATIPSISTAKGIAPGRMITILCDTTAGGAITLTNNAASTTNGQFDLGAADLVLGTTDVVTLVQRADGVWQKVSNSDN